MLMSYDLMKCGCVFKNTTITTTKTKLLECLENTRNSLSSISNSQPFPCLQDFRETLQYLTSAILII